MHRCSPNRRFLRNDPRRFISDRRTRTIERIMPGISILSTPGLSRTGQGNQLLRCCRIGTQRTRIPRNASERIAIKSSGLVECASEGRYPDF